jgi:hypothetical protein
VTAQHGATLQSPEHFCIAPNGDFEGNKDTCYWGLPSIEADLAVGGKVNRAPPCIFP